MFYSIVFLQFLRFLFKLLINDLFNDQIFGFVSSIYYYLLLSLEFNFLKTYCHYFGTDFGISFIQKLLVIRLLIYAIPLFQSFCKNNH